jgi:hypothetical protein
MCLLFHPPPSGFGLREATGVREVGLHMRIQGAARDLILDYFYWGARVLFFTRVLLLEERGLFMPVFFFFYSGILELIYMHTDLFIYTCTDLLFSTARSAYSASMAAT